MELFGKIVNAWMMVTIFAKSSVLDVWKGYTNVSTVDKVQIIMTYVLLLNCLKIRFSIKMLLED